MWKWDQEWQITRPALGTASLSVFGSRSLVCVLRQVTERVGVLWASDSLYGEPLKAQDTGIKWDRGRKGLSPHLQGTLSKQGCSWLPWGSSLAAEPLLGFCEHDSRLMSLGNMTMAWWCFCSPAAIHWRCLKVRDQIQPSYPRLYTSLSTFTFQTLYVCYLLNSCYRFWKESREFEKVWCSHPCIRRRLKTAGRTDVGQSGNYPWIPTGSCFVMRCLCMAESLLPVSLPVLQQIIASSIARGMK